MADTVARASQVCYVNAQGELKCGSTIAAYDSRYENALKPDIESIPGIGPNRVALLLQIIDKVMKSPLDDSCIGNRLHDTVDSVVDVLATESPIMLLYRYNTLPGNIMGAYYVQQDDFEAARDALDHYAPGNLKASC